MIDTFFKIFGFLFKLICPEKLIEWKTKVARLTFDDPLGVDDFINLYEETFPYDGRNYTAKELLEAVRDVNNDKKHVKADNIFLLAKYEDKAIGFIACFYYPEVKYGIIGYIGRTKKLKGKAKFATVKLIKKLKSILLKYGCQMIVFELEIGRRDDVKDMRFKSCAEKMDLDIYELGFDYYRPKLDLQSSIEEKLRLFVVPINKVFNNLINKSEVIDIIKFLHFYCYGDFYDLDDSNFEPFQNYLKERVNIYETRLQDKIIVK